jgi:hypothetical protein
MQRRTLLSLVNLGVAGAALAVLFLLPQYATYAIYGFFAWFVVSLAIVWGSRGSRPVGRSTVAPAPTGPGGALPTGRATTAPVAPISFCAYCAADLPIGAARCPACGHPRLALG